MAHTITLLTRVRVRRPRHTRQLAHRGVDDRTHVAHQLKGEAHTLPHRHPPRPPARKPVAAACRVSLGRTPAALANSNNNATPPRAAPRVWHVVRRAVAAVAGRCRGSARRESGVRRATASGRAAP
eukprot:scaffold5714_cov71-Phaeocystis_antarctica.AAC.3